MGWLNVIKAMVRFFEPVFARRAVLRAADKPVLVYAYTVIVLARGGYLFFRGFRG